MERYIKQLLVSDSRAIIPGFGAIHALKDAEGVSLSFNKYLNFDDGKLAEAIVSAEGVSADEASARVSDFAQKCTDKVGSGLMVQIPGVGSFVNDAEGDLTFVAVEDFDAAEPDESPVGESLAKEAEPETLAKEAEPEVVVKEAEPDVEAPVAKEAEPVVEPVSYVYEDDESGRWKWVALVIALLLLLLWLLLFVFFKDNAVYRAFCGKPKTEQVAQPKTEAPKEELKVEPKEEPKVEPKQEAAPAPVEAVKLDKRYNIIVGTYKDEKGAIARVKDLRSKGFDEAFVGMRKGMFVAVIAAYSSLSQAEAMQEKIVDGQYHIESWITNSGE